MIYPNQSPEPTYEELKLFDWIYENRPDLRPEPTYEELKLGKLAREENEGVWSRAYL